MEKTALPGAASQTSIGGIGNVHGASTSIASGNRNAVDAVTAYIRG